MDEDTLQAMYFLYTTTTDDPMSWDEWSAKFFELQARLEGDK